MTVNQTELFVEKSETGTSEATASDPPVAARSQHTLQDYLPQESLLAMKIAQEAATMDEFRERLESSLPQNSAVTRKRYVESISRWFFKEGLRGFAPAVWTRFQNPDLQLCVQRYLYLTVEPIVANCVTAVLSRLSEGIVVPADYLAKNSAKLEGHELNSQTRNRLLTNLRKLGFLERSSAGDRVITPAFSKAALLLALHHAFNIDAPRSIEFTALAANPFWRFVGLRSEDALRDFLKEAEHAGLLGKYVVADRLEQVTTCYSLAALIEKGVEL
jgi:hypothetical protein